VLIAVGACLLLALAAATSWALTTSPPVPGSPLGATVQLGGTAVPVHSPVCPAGAAAKNCTFVMTRVTALETITNGAGYPTAVKQPGQIVALWDIDPGDWRTLTPEQIVGAVEKQARAPAVILLHNGKSATIDALPRIIADFRRAGFRFVTLSQLQNSLPLDEINDPVRIKL